MGEERFRNKKADIQVEVESAEKLSYILKLANERKQRVRVKQGGAAVPINLEKTVSERMLIVDLRRMNRVELHKESGYVEVEPFVRQQDLNAFLSPYGYEFPDVVPPVTLGGIVSINMSGHLVDSHSEKLGDHILGLEVVLPTGEIIETGTKALRKISGIDLTRLFIGSQAIFGVLTKIRLRLIPKPLEKAWMVASFDSAVELASAVIRVLNGSLGFYPRKLEFIDATFLNDRLGGDEFEGSVLIAETAGDSPGGAKWKMDKLTKAVSEQARYIKVIEEDEWNRIWEARAGLTPKTVIKGTDRLTGGTFDPPLQNLVETIKALYDFRAKFRGVHPDTLLFFMGHIGGPTVHVQLRCPFSWSKEKRLQVTKKFMRDTIQIKLKYATTMGDGGPILPTHRAWFRAHYGEKYYGLIWKLKAIFDPNHILNMDRLE